MKFVLFFFFNQDQNTPGFCSGFFLQEEPIRGFRVCDYLPFMEELERSYRGVVLAAMKNIGSAAA